MPGDEKDIYKKFKLHIIFESEMCNRHDCVID